MKMSHIWPTCPILRKITGVLHNVESLKTERHCHKCHNVIRKTRFKGWFSLNNMSFTACFRSRGTISSPYRFSSPTWGIFSLISYFFRPFCLPFLFHVLPLNCRLSFTLQVVLFVVHRPCVSCYVRIVAASSVSLMFHVLSWSGHEGMLYRAQNDWMQRHGNSKALLLIDWLNAWRRGNMLRVQVGREILACGSLSRSGQTQLGEPKIWSMRTDTCFSLQTS
jgi:hypothetical protein